MKLPRIPLLATLSLNLALLAGCAGETVRPGSGDGYEEAPLAGEYKVRRYRLKNGLRLLVVEDHSSPTFAYQTWFRVGSRDEEVKRTGLAHLFEHMMFKETRNLKDGEFDRLLEGAGAEGENAFTSRDYTAYVQEMPKDKLDLIARLEAERMVNLVVNEKAFKTETEVVQNERRFRNENNPDGLMYQELFSVAFTQHPYHWPVIGYAEDLAAMSAEDAVKFYRSYYSPNHATVVVVGDVDPDEVHATVQRYYGEIPSQEAPVRVIPEEPAQTSPRRKNLRLNIQVEKILMGYHTPAMSHEDMATLNLIQAILTGGKSSRLHRALVDTGIATGVESYAFEDKDPTLFMIGATLQKKKRAAQAESAIAKELERLAREPVPAQELERARNRINFDFFENLNDSKSKAHFLGHYETNGKSFQDGLRLHERLQSVTAEQVRAAAKKYFDRNNRTVITGAPK